MKIILNKYFFQVWTISKKLARFFGLKNTIVFFSLVGKAVSYFLEKEKKISKAQLELAQFKNSEQIITDNFVHISKSIGEILQLESYFEKNYFTFNSDETDEKTAKGALALSAHLGCFEFLAAYYAKHRKNLFVIGRNLNFDSAQRTLENIRSSYGAETIWRENKNSMRILYKGIKSGGIIASLIDQDTTLESKFSDFFGLEAAYPIAPIKLAIRQKIPIYTSFIYRVRNTKHHVWSKEIVYDPEDKNAEQKILDIYSKRVENLIRLYPEQWIWWHRRWRRNQKERIGSTNEYLKYLKAKTN